MSLDETTRGGPAKAPPKEPAPAATLVVVHSPDLKEQGKNYPLGQDELTIGRHPGNALVVVSSEASRRHARIFESQGAHVIADLGSTNGTFLNSKPVKERALRNGDVLRIASTILKYVVND